MNQTDHRYKCFFSVLLTVAFLVANEVPLIADPPQSSQSMSSQASSDQSVADPSTIAQDNNTAQKPTDPLPESPQPQSAQTSQSSSQTPSGAAGAKAANVKGAPVAQPVGAAVAPVRQRGHRSLLIKIGLLAGAGIAVGAVVALSEKSPSRPPGATSY